MKRLLLGFVVFALLFASIVPPAMAQSVRGGGETSNPPNWSSNRYSVDAWLDEAGVAHGHFSYIGGIPLRHPEDLNSPGGPADPYIYEVTDIVFDGNTAYVTGVVVASPQGQGNGSVFELAFTDNSATGEPDEIDFVPLEAGNITVDD